MRKPKVAFTLTATESRALRLRRSGLKIREIESELGITTGSIGSMLSNAAEKERLMAIDERKRTYGSSSLSVARGRTRMEGTK